MCRGEGSCSFTESLLPRSSSRNDFWKTLRDGAPLHWARISGQGLNPTRAGTGSRALCHNGVTSDALGAKEYAETLIGRGFGACRWRGTNGFIRHCIPESHPTLLI